MPCDTRTTSSVELSAATDVTLLTLALQSLGYTVHQQRDGQPLHFSGRGVMLGTFVNGTLTSERSDGRAHDVNEIKRAYSREVITSASKRFGWQLTQGKTAQQFTATRRY